MIRPMLIHKDFTLIPKLAEDNWEIEILTGNFTGVIFMFDRLDFEGDHLFFKFNIVSSPIPALDKDDEEFKKTVKEILISILDFVAKRNMTKGIK